jgi:hypothetical protein
LGIPDRAAAARIRLRRQRILHDEFRPPQCTFYVHEQALRLPVGGDRVMNEQMLQLVLLADRPNIVIRVVPISAGARAALGGPFMLFQYDLHQPLVYQENGVSGLFVEDLEYVQRCQGQLSRISWVAMDAEESRVLLATMASKYDRLDGDHDPDDLAEEQLHQ